MHALERSINMAVRVLYRVFTSLTAHSLTNHIQGGPGVICLTASLVFALEVASATSSEAETISRVQITLSCRCRDRILEMAATLWDAGTLVMTFGGSRLLGNNKFYGSKVYKTNAKYFYILLTTSTEEFLESERLEDHTSGHLASVNRSNAFYQGIWEN